ncbi:MAG TPA: ABC transporter substrate-binding protein, partial [Terriglobales bacterium]|nr:ABC transporter substrate-binding protein [Terriglobales bacterium]
MRLSGWLWVAVTSVVLWRAATAETRPQYGSTLRAATSIAPTSLEPADKAQPESIARQNLTRLMFDTLLTMDDRGRLKPALAVAWQASSGNQRWEFRLRRGVKFHDGSLMTAQAVAASIRAANPEWTVVPGTDSVTIERDAPDPNVPAQLARARNAITRRSEGGTSVGTGPFYIRDWQPGKRLSLAANEDYWNGRPFLNGIEIEFGKSGRDQIMALDLGNADVVELPPDQTRRMNGEGKHVASSLPLVLMTLRFSREPQSADEGKLRRALGLSIDRTSIRNVVLQGAGEASAAILPDWLSGYAFVFPAGQDLERARQLCSEVKQTPTWTLAYDTNDPLARLIAERVVLNAKDARLVIQVAPTSNTDLRLERIPLASLNPRVALEAVALGAGSGNPGNSI